MTASAEVPSLVRRAPDRPLPTVTVSGRSGSYEAVSCRPGHFKAERQLSWPPVGRIRPKAVIANLKKQTFGTFELSRTAVRRRI